VRAAVADGAGSLRLEHVEAPAPADGQVLVRVVASGVNPVDDRQRRGELAPPPSGVPGLDVGGVVERSRAPAFAPGDEVFGIAASGGYAELATADAAAVARRPPALGVHQAAALPVSALTAWQALFGHGGLRRGATVLIVGGAGGVGHLAVQFARRAGARVVATGSAHNRGFVLGLGAEDFVDRHAVAIADAVRGVDLVLDTAGGAATRALISTVAPGGVLVSTAYPRPADWAETEALAARAGVRAEVVLMTPDAGRLAAIADLVAVGEVRVEVAVRTLSEIARAPGQAPRRGKLVLRVGA
jgi:NADPH:quinone reductase-like Zn-dependent oxidoreductase